MVGRTLSLPHCRNNHRRYNIALLLDRGTTTAKEKLTSTIFLIIGCGICITSDFSQQSSSLDLVSATILATLAIICLILFLPMVASVDKGNPRKRLITISVVTNLSILGFFKYFNFFVESFASFYLATTGTEASIPLLNIILPVGISFYTFQSMSYSIDVYRKELRASKSLIDFGAYLSFFPQLVAGPIERGKNLLPQFQKSRSFSLEQFKEGIWLITWGLFKKIVIADNLAIFVNSVFWSYDSSNTTGLPEAGGLVTLIAVYAFAFQIYADFSGYSDIARGCAKLLGFELMLNFNIPYISTNPSEFWQRWHISLSSWLRDYLYIPLGGNRGSKFATQRNLMLTMLLGGLWHGANWTFLAWGFYQGLILVLYRTLGMESAGKGKTGLVKCLHIAWMFQLTCLGWLIFRSQNLPTISTFLTSIFTDMRITTESLDALTTLGMYCAPLLAIQAYQIYKDQLYVMINLHWFARLNLWLTLILAILSLGTKKEVEFIYFAF